MAFTQVAITGSFQNADGTPATGTVTFAPTATMRNSGTGPETTVASPITVDLVAGELDTTLAATDDPATLPTGVAYAVKIETSGTRSGERFLLDVPYDGGSIDLTTAVRSEATSPDRTQYLTRLAGDARYKREDAPSERSTPAFHENFTGTVGTDWDDRWTLFVEGTGGTPGSKLIDGGYGRQTTPTSAYGTAWARVASAPADGEILFRRRINSTGERYDSTHFRYDSVSGNGYVFEVAQGEAYINRKTAFASAATVATDTEYSQTAGWHWFRIRYEGPSLKAKWWADHTEEPIEWNLEGTDSTYSAAGSVSLSTTSGASGGAVTADFDDFTVWDLPTNKGYVDAIGTPSAVDDSIVRRDSNGWFAAYGVYGLDAPTAADVATNKGYVDRIGRSVRVYALNTAQTLEDGVGEIIDYNSTAYNDDTSLYTVNHTNNTITVNEDGLLMMTTGCYMSGGTGGYRYLSVLLNGSVARDGGFGVEIECTVTLADTMRVSAGDVISVSGYVESTGSVTVNTNAHYFTYLSLTYLSE